MLLKIYSFVRNISPERFDYHYIRNLIDHLKLKGYTIEWYDLDGNDKFIYKNDCEVLINQGSITIFEFANGKFKTYDFGDAPTLTLQLSKSKNFIGAAIGQYNEKLWDNTIIDKKLRAEIVAGVYPESFWGLGIENYESIQEYRNSIVLRNELYWRGSIYENPKTVEFKCRESINIISQNLKNDFYFGNTPLPFNAYIEEAIKFKLALCYGVGGGYICGDHCFRDIELYGLGIPTIRPKYAVKNYNELIADFHYIAVDLEFDDKFRYKNPTFCAEKIINRYKSVINDTKYLKYIATNARNWYINNLSYPNIIENIVKTLKL